MGIINQNENFSSSDAAVRNVGSESLEERQRLASNQSTD